MTLEEIDAIKARRNFDSDNVVLKREDFARLMDHARGAIEAIATMEAENVALLAVARTAKKYREVIEKRHHGRMPAEVEVEHLNLGESIRAIPESVKAKLE